MRTLRPQHLPGHRALPAALALLCLSACGGDSAAAARDQRRATARELVQEFATALLAELDGAIARGGPVEAIAVCSEQAPRIAAARARDGYRVRRIGTRVRNRATNAPTEAEREILDRFAGLPASERAAAYHEEDRQGGSIDWAFYAPIFVGKPACLLCHGLPAEIREPVARALAARYPGDQATGYALGDLRGAFVVEHEARPR